MAHLRELISELIQVNRAVLEFLENQKIQQAHQTMPSRAEMMVGNAEETIQRYKSISKQKRKKSQSEKCQ